MVCILQKLKGIVDEEILKICLNDLEVKGFIFQNTQGYNDEWGYAITYLGGTSSTTKLNGLMEKFVIYRDTVSSQESMLNTLAKTIKTYDKKT